MPEKDEIDSVSEKNSAEASMKAAKAKKLKKAAKSPRKRSTKKQLLVPVLKSKRKEAVARAYITQGKGNITINNQNLDLIQPKEIRNFISEPLHLSDAIEALRKKIDIDIKVYGGGASGQAQAARSAIAKGIAAYSNNDSIKKMFASFDRSLIIDDYRRVEPKKYKGPKARARFQTSYR
ncbi:MAG: 30S ribosomal protein S9 [Candidatus Micrarchaeia archaeon]